MFSFLRRLEKLEKEQKKTMATIDQLAADFATLQTDFSAFVVNVQTALANIAAGGVTAAQQAELDTVDAGLTAMDSTVKGIAFPKS
jgi:hypothetical protein